MSYSVCVGKDAANQVLFIALVTILWAFNIEKAKYASGRVITPPHGDLDVVDDGIVVCMHFVTVYAETF